MLPFITVFGIQIPMYGLMITIGALAGTLLAVYSTRRFSREDLLFSICYAGIGAMVGAKVLFLAITLPQLIKEGVALSWPLLQELFAAGFVFYGGLLGAVAAVMIYARKFKLPVFALTEALIPSVPLVHAFGRIGCFCAGCCYGRPMAPPWGMVFSSPLAPAGVALFPVQLVEAGFNLVLFAWLFAYSRRRRKPGQVLGLYLAAYGIIRFGLEYLRYDAVRGIALGLSTSQWISLALAPVGVLLLLISGRWEWLKRADRGK